MSPKSVLVQIKTVKRAPRVKKFNKKLKFFFESATTTLIIAGNSFNGG